MILVTSSSNEMLVLGLVLGYTRGSFHLFNKHSVLCCGVQKQTNSTHMLIV